MPFDKLDKKAREAAEQYNAAYNEEAWSKMEALLDKHMPLDVVQPEIKERKFHEKWLFLFLSLIAVSFIILLTKPWKNSRRNNGPAEIIVPTKPADNSEKFLVAIKPPDNRYVDKSTTGNSQSKKSLDKFSIPTKLNTKNGQDIHSQSGRIHAGSAVLRINKSNVDESSNIQINKENIVTANSQNTFLQDGFIHQKISNRPIDNKNFISNNIPVLAALKVNEIKAVKAKKPGNPKKNTFSNSFSLSVSAGPDVSAVNVNNIGTFEILYGAGVAYKFGKRWQVRTGFYTVNKVYNARPSEYNPPSMFWNYYPGLETIKANCNVNEIPLIINYTFRQNTKQVWFASAGLSSYFMKRETYDYHSKTSTGYWDKSYTIHGENKHYLSSLRIAAGYEKALNKTISFTAEPYINLPLSGVGYGKVKLSSAGLLFSLNIKPFTKK